MSNNTRHPASKAAGVLISALFIAIVASVLIYALVLVWVQIKLVLGGF